MIWRTPFFLAVLWPAVLTVPALADTGPCKLGAEHEIQICGSGDGGGDRHSRERAWCSG